MKKNTHLLFLCLLALCVLAGSSVAFAQRDPLKWPFDKTSIWNLPIHKEAVYVSAGIKDAANFEVDEDIIIMKPNEPGMNIETNYAGWSAGGDARCSDQGPVLLQNMPIPRDYIYSPSEWHGATPNAGASILMPNGKIVQTQPFAKCSEDLATSLYTWQEGCELTGECIAGAHGGSHLSAVGGTLRVGELTAGIIRHVLKINLWGKENFYNGDGGRRWPAPKADGGFNDPSHPNYYGGTNPEMRIGALLALHKDVILESLSNNSLGLETEAALIIARALQDYGAYTVDNTAWDTYAIISEVGPEGRVSDEFKALYGYDMNYYGNPNSAWARDIKKLFANLYVISNNTETTVGGGPKNDLVNRRAPAAPDFTAAQPLRIMPLGDSKTEGQGGNGQSSYRGFLRTRLVKAGYAVDYVGPRSNYADGDTIPNDLDHAGFGGYTIGPDTQKWCATCETTGLYEHIQNYLPLADPDIVLVAVGVNDMFNGSNHPANYAATAPERYRNLINKILELKPNVRIIVGTIEPVKWDKNWGSDPNDNNLGSLNAAIRSIADSSDSDNIFFADVRNRMLVDYSAADFYDDLHLSQTGARKSADAWFNALIPVLQNIPNNSAPDVAITNPAGSVTVDAPATVLIEVTATDSDGMIAKVEFYSGTTKIGEDTTAPYSFTWSNVEEGTYTIHAIAIDDLYRSTKSGEAVINVTSTDGYIKFNGTGIGSPGSYGGSGATFHKALDGDANTFFDGPSANTQWVGLDLGAARMVKKVRYIPRDGWASRLVGGKIQGANAADFSDAEDLYTITETPTQDIFTTGRFENSTLYQYYRFLSPANGYGNIAEIEFWGDPNDPVNLAPTCTLLAPLSNSTYAPGAFIIISASATDSDGTIDQVEFYANNILIGSDNSAPYSFSWQATGAGSYSITARAVDNAGVKKYSAPAVISVGAENSSVLYAEDFNLNTANGWQANGGTWTATNQRFRSSATNGEYTSFYSEREFSNYTYAVDAFAEWNNDIGIVFNFQDVNNYYLLLFNSNSKTATIRKRKGGVNTVLATNTFTGNGTGTRHVIRVENTIDSTTISINGLVIFDNIATVDFTRGKIGLYSFYCPSTFDNIVVTSNNTAPAVALTSPADSVTYTAPATISLVATASDADGSLSKVEFYSGNMLLASDDSSPYSFTWTGVSVGEYNVTAKATDNEGLSVISSAITVFVKNVTESVSLSSPPMSVAGGESYTVNVNYSASENRIIDLYLYDGNWNKIASKHVLVQAGAGVQPIQITLPGVSSTITNGIWAVNLWKSDWSGVVKSNIRTGVTVQAGPATVTSADVTFTSVCSNDASLRRWRVINKSNTILHIQWHVYKTTQRGELSVGGGETVFFETLTVNGPNTTIIEFGDGIKLSKASGNSICPDNLSVQSENTSVTVYPVPAEGNLTISIKGFESPVVTLKDMWNTVVFQQKIQSEEIVIDSPMVKGVYFLIVDDGRKRETKRVLVGK